MLPYIDNTIISKNIGQIRLGARCKLRNLIQTWKYCVCVCLFEHMRSFAKVKFIGAVEYWECKRISVCSLHTRAQLNRICRRKTHFRNANKQYDFIINRTSFNLSAALFAFYQPVHAIKISQKHKNNSTKCYSLRVFHVTANDNTPQQFGIKLNSNTLSEVREH